MFQGVFNGVSGILVTPGDFKGVSERFRGFSVRFQGRFRDSMRVFGDVSETLSNYPEPLELHLRPLDTSPRTPRHLVKPSGNPWNPIRSPENL